jgi:putative Mg2+ transporter-C (MgtC) family protein
MLEALLLTPWFASVLDFVIKLMLALVIGFLIGLERESRGKDAGISTHALVIMGAMLFTYLSGIVDPLSTSRISAQIVTGIGFLGAGLIIKDGASVRNLTTAAGLWFAAAIGMAIGYGYYLIAAVAALAAIIASRIPHVLEKRD